MSTTDCGCPPPEITDWQRMDAWKTAHGYPDCSVHVDCDENCQALEEPGTLDEVRATMVHWREHGYLSGCSHAC